MSEPRSRIRQLKVKGYRVGRLIVVRLELGTFPPTSWLVFTIQMTSDRADQSLAGGGRWSRQCLQSSVKLVVDYEGESPERARNTARPRDRVATSWSGT